VVPQPIPWAIPGETRVFLVHSEGCEEPHQGALFGYFLLERFEIVLDPATYESLGDPNRIPWPPELFQDIPQTVKEEHAFKPFKPTDIERLRRIVEGQFEKRQREFARQVKQAELTTRERSGPSLEELIKGLSEEILEEVLEQLVEKILENIVEENARDRVKRALGRQNGQAELLNRSVTAGEARRFCSPPSTGGYPWLAHKRIRPGAIYVVDALTALITDLFIDALNKKLKDPFIDALNKELKDPSHVDQEAIRLKEEIFKRVVKQAHQRRAQKRYRKRNAMRGLPEDLKERVVQRGELVLFPRPFPVIQRCQKASFRSPIRVDGDELLREISRCPQGKNCLVKVPYCTGPKAKRPMTKAQLQAHFAGELRINKKMVGDFFEKLSSKASKDIRQTGGFVLPGFGRFYLKSDGQIGFRAYKGL